MTYCKALSKKYISGPDYSPLHESSSHSNRKLNSDLIIGVLLSMLQCPSPRRRSEREMAQAAENGQNALVIVESPTKANTIRKYLGNGFTVEASMGHVRDLPSSAAEMPAEARGKSWSRLAVDIENGFRPVYVVPKDKRKLSRS